MSCCVFVFFCWIAGPGFVYLDGFETMVFECVDSFFGSDCEYLLFALRLEKMK